MLIKRLNHLSKSIADLGILNLVGCHFVAKNPQSLVNLFHFYLRQWVRLHRKGYPSSVKQDYLRLVERQMMRVKQVYIAFYLKSRVGL